MLVICASLVFSDEKLSSKSNKSNAGAGSSRKVGGNTYNNISKTHFYFNVILHCRLRDLTSAMSFIQNLCVWDRCEQWQIKLKNNWYDNLTVSLCHALLQIMTPAEVLSAQFFAKMGSSKLTNGRAFHQGGVSILPFTLICYWKTNYWVWTDFS